MRKWLFGLAMILAIAAGLAAARGSAGGRQAEGEAAKGETADDYLNPALTPEESAAIQRDIDRHVERTRRRAREEAGVDDPRLRRTGPPPPPPRSVNDYQQCMGSAAHAPTPEDRAIMEGACRNLPGAP